eukprot:126951-Pelagomonas_calceolata.AAC.1
MTQTGRPSTANGHAHDDTDEVHSVNRQFMGMLTMTQTKGTCTANGHAHDDNSGKEFSVHCHWTRRASS